MTTFLLIVSLLALAVLCAPLYASGPGLKDASAKLTRALPNGAATVYATPGFDTGVTPGLGTQNRETEWLLTAPALNTTQCPDAKTVKYSILTDTVDPIDASSTVLYADILTQTGAGGAGAAADSVRFKLKSDAQRILGFKIVGSASGDATGASATLELLG